MKLRERIHRYFEPPVVPKIRELINQAESFGLPERDLKNAKEMLEVDEWGEGFDIIVIQLYEFDIPVTAQFISLSEEVIEDMKIDKGRYHFLHELPIRTSKE